MGLGAMNFMCGDYWEFFRMIFCLFSCSFLFLLNHGTVSFFSICYNLCLQSDFKFFSFFPFLKCPSILCSIPSCKYLSCFGLRGLGPKEGALSRFVTPDRVTDHVMGQVTCHRTFLSLFMFVYLCLVTCPILETVYSSHAEGTYFPQLEYQLQLPRKLLMKP